jgi:hypothetical protein
MNITKLLDIDKVFCITKFSNQRLNNILEQQHRLNLDIEFVYPEFDDVPVKSLKDTFIKIVKENKNKYKKILILEDDFWTDLTEKEIIFYIENSDYKNISFDVFTLGSPIFEIENKCKNIFKINSFGYAHSLIINLEHISNELINKLNDNDEPLDSVLSKMSKIYNFYSFEDSIFQQKNYLESSISPNKSPENFNPVFRYLRDKNINTNKIIKISEQDTFFENTSNAWGYYTDGIIKRKIDFNSNCNLPLIIKVYDYHSGTYTNEFSINFENFWIEFNLLTPKVVLEIKDNNNNIIYSEIINRS